MKNNYSNYSNSTATYMRSVEKFLKKKYGEVGDELTQPLKILADNLEIFNESMKEIRERGLVVTAHNGAPCKNPALKTQLDSQVQIYKFLQEFGVTPRSRAKINLPSEDDDELKELIGE